MHGDELEKEMSRSADQLDAKCRLRSLTIKPTATCLNACPYCKERRRFLVTRNGSPRLHLKDWKRVVSEAVALGANRIDISGGEPTFYTDLFDLVEVCAASMITSVNSNGHGLSAEVLKTLQGLRLSNISVSLMSMEPDKHDRLRRTRGSHRLAIDAIDACSRIGMHTTVHFILSRHNYSELPALVTFLSQMHVKAFVLAYPENDHKRRYLLMSRSQISQFRERVIPEARDRFTALFGYDVGHRFDGLFREPQGCDFAAGVYDTDTHVCTIPSTFMLIYPDGRVLPCNAIEYTHHPVVGSARETSLSQIWKGGPYSAFRRSTYQFCLRCPMKHMFYHEVRW